MNQLPQTNHARAPLLINQNILNRSSIFKRIDLRQGQLGQERAKKSQLYHQLEKKIQMSKANHQDQLRIIDQRRDEIEMLIGNQKKRIQQTKMHLWELKNQIMYLQQTLTNEQGDYEFNQEEDDEQCQYQANQDCLEAQSYQEGQDCSQSKSAIEDQDDQNSKESLSEKRKSSIEGQENKEQSGEYAIEQIRSLSQLFNNWDVNINNANIAEHQTQ